MEISDFLLKEQTFALRKSFFENFKKKQLELLEWMQTLEKEEGLSGQEAVSLTQKLFNEIHRYKGTGGTYGFNEISVVCREMLRFIRPPFNEKRKPFPHELREALLLEQKLIQFVPDLEKGLNDLSGKEAPLSCVLLLDAERGPFVDELDFFSLEQHYLVISSYQPRDVFPLMNQLAPRSILLHAPYPDYSIPLLVKKLGAQFSCPLFFLGDPQQYEGVNEYGKLSANRDVLPYTSDRDSVRALVRKMLP